MGKNFRETLNEQLQKPEFKAEWDALESERRIMQAIIEGVDNRSSADTDPKGPFSPD